MKENTRRRENPETYGNEEKQRHDVCKNVGRGEAALMPKKWGGKEAVASVEPGEAAQVSGFRRAGNNSLLSGENVNLFMRKGIITSVF